MSITNNPPFPTKHFPQIILLPRAEILRSGQRADISSTPKLVFSTEDVVLAVVSPSSHWSTLSEFIQTAVTGLPKLPFLPAMLLLVAFYRKSQITHFATISAQKSKLHFPSVLEKKMKKVFKITVTRSKRPAHVYKPKASLQWLRVIREQLLVQVPFPRTPRNTIETWLLSHEGGEEDREKVRCPISPANFCNLSAPLFIYTLRDCGIKETWRQNTTISNAGRSQH